MSVGLCNWASLPPSSSSSCQTAAWFDLRIGRRPAPVPAHLTKIVYIPRHDSNTYHLPLYEAGDLYRNAVGDSPIGSTLYAVKLGMAEKPRDNTLCHRVVYLSDMYSAIVQDQDQDQDGSGSGCRSVGIIRLQKRELGNRGVETRLSGSSTTTPTTTTTQCEKDDDDRDEPQRSRPMLIESRTAAGFTSTIRMETSFPIPPTIWGSDTIHHPYFTLRGISTNSHTPTPTSPGNNNGEGIYFLPPRLEWQIHPIADGPLRYTLVDPSRDEQHNNSKHDVATDEKRVWAIYHDMGWGKSLWQGCSEGMLLLPERRNGDMEKENWKKKEADDLLEGIIVTSLLGVLRQVRMLQGATATTPTSTSTSSATAAAAAAGANSDANSWSRKHVKNRSKLWHRVMTMLHGH
ncbi:hypothetical protein B0T17DRAFT_613150 [Bombardia bombarda]|uniref:Uncharacterized protein n=1 Tax=Bombardia bombarda TaxID=252184 RepID=A0AA39XMN7_9PEZI|nr:hypothetical protein B0T17DRAFT_613150 [Bombardia bombarda]